QGHDSIMDRRINRQRAIDRLFHLFPRDRRNGARILSGFYFSASLLTNSTMRFLTTSGSTLTPNVFESKRTPDGVPSCRVTKSFPFCCWDGFFFGTICRAAHCECVPIPARFRTP